MRRVIVGNGYKATGDFKGSRCVCLLFC